MIALLFVAYIMLTVLIQAQHERADNCALRAENDKIRCENIAIREALKHVICPSCGGPPVGEDPYFDEQKLHMENLHLKEEVKMFLVLVLKLLFAWILINTIKLFPNSNMCDD